MYVNQPRGGPRVPRVAWSRANASRAREFRRPGESKMHHVKLQRWLSRTCRQRQSAAGENSKYRTWCSAAGHSCMVDTSCGPVAADDLAVLSYPQWQGADHANRERYEAGAEAVRREIQTLIPPERACHHQVAVSSVLEPEWDEAEPRAWSCIARQQRNAFDLLAKTAPTRAITLGGDCGVEPASIGYFNARHNGNLALLWLDSHGDLNSNTESPSGNYHGMALRDLIEPGRYTSYLGRGILP
eukprot:COSAG02_NODE_1137_length_14313_cov_6.111369_12_plen_243_part_00